MLVTLPDGRQFPQHDGETLCWDVGAYNTYADEQNGFQRMRAVIRAMMAHRPKQIQHERLEMLKASFDRMFGHNARKVLGVIEQEIGEGGAA